jgi:hypothetical protein
MNKMKKISEKTIIRFYDIEPDISDEDRDEIINDEIDSNITIGDIETTLGEIGWDENDGLTPSDFIEERGSDYISDECGFCINGYNWVIVK